MSANPLDFNDFIQLIRNGEPVAAGVPNRPLGALDQRTRYLWDLLNAAFTGSTIFARQVTVESDANVGMPVFFNAATSRFERALAGVMLDAATGALMPSDASQVWGVVFRKINATLCDVLLSGYATLDISAALAAGESVRAGCYYLSRTTPGRLQQTRPAVATPVLRSDGAGRVFVLPQWAGNGSEHEHIHFRLKPVPAGAHVDPGPGGHHEITSPNVHVEGWLPAGHASFAGLAPYNAKFGYNLAANSKLKAAWPPMPPEEAVLLKSGAQVPDGDQGLVVFDANGIWWLSDCYGDVPFPDNADTAFEAVSESAEVSITPDDCPYVDRVRLDLYFTRFAFLSADTVVTSLTTQDERLNIFCRGRPDTPASVGPLEISLNLDFVSEDSDPGGYQALKLLDPETGKFRRGPVATGVYANAAGITLTSTFQTTETIEDVERTIHHGTVGLDLESGAEREVGVTLVKLEGAVEAYYQNIMYLGLPAGEVTQPRFRLRVPSTLDVASPKLRLQLRLLGRAAGGMPDLTLTYRRVPSAASPANLPTSDSAVAITTSQTVTANQYVDKAAASFTIVAGDDVYVTVQREDDDSYAGEVGILGLFGVIVSGA